MKKHMYVIAAAVLVSVVMLSGASELKADDACAKMCMHKKSGKAGMDEMLFRKFHIILESAKELELSAQQVESIKGLKLKTKKDLIKKESEIDLAALDVKAELWKEPINVNTVNPLIDKKYELKKEKAKIMIAALAALKSTLSKEQMDKLKAVYSQKSNMCGRKRMMCHAMMKCPMCGMKHDSGSKSEKEAVETEE